MELPPPKNGADLVPKLTNPTGRDAQELDVKLLTLCIHNEVGNEVGKLPEPCASTRRPHTQTI